MCHGGIIKSIQNQKRINLKNIRKTAPFNSPILRVFYCGYKQKSKTIHCPIVKNMKGKNILITGGAAGIGEHISKALISAGAAVTSLSRGVTKGDSIPGLKSVQMDLGKPSTIKEAVEQLHGQKFDVFISNAGIVLKDYQEVESGLEKTFAVNVLGPHILLKLLLEKNMLASNARIVMTSGEIYALAKDCSTSTKEKDYKSNIAYAESKLANLWQALELTKRFPNLHPIAIHPGVVSSNFGGNQKNTSGIGSWFKKRLMLTEKEGAQSALIAATQAIPKGTYWHNTMGIVDLKPNDIAQNRNKSKKLWDFLEELSKRWV
jgi:NAD(P)-dependent dehydrogenase (short-subunit alcohol dehydrogenase family)